MGFFFLTSLFFHSYFKDFQIEFYYSRSLDSANNIDIRIYINIQTHKDIQLNTEEAERK